MNSQIGIEFKITKSSLNKHLPIYWSCLIHFYVSNQFISSEKKNNDLAVLAIFENFDRYFGTLGTGIAQVGHADLEKGDKQILVNFAVLSPQKYRMACFFLPIYSELASK